MKPSVSMVKDTEIEDLIGSDAASIAILSRMPENSNIKVLMLSSVPTLTHLLSAPPMITCTMVTIPYDSHFYFYK